MTHDLGGLLYACLTSINDFYLLISNFVLDLSDLIRLINLASLLFNARLFIENIDIDDIVLVKLLGPSFRDPILNLLFEDLFIGTL